METFVESADNFQLGITSPMISECLNTPEFRFYVRTMGNPVLKMILDKSQEELVKSQHIAAKRLCEETNEQIRDDYFEELIAIESHCASTKVYDYFLAVKANNDLDKEITELNKENKKLDQDINDLKRSMNIKN